MPEHKHSFKIEHRIQDYYRQRYPSITEASIWMVCEVDGCFEHKLLSRESLIQSPYD